MPCHHHLHRTGCCCCSCAPSCCASCTAASPPPPTAADHLLQLLATQLLLHPDPSPPSPQPPSPQPPPRRRSKHSRAPGSDVNNFSHHHQTQTHQQEEIPLLQSLLQRISALESQLSNQHSPPSPPSPPRRTATAAIRPARSLRDLAARTIQIHFRRHLVRRSQSLRNLHHLAVVKSRAAALRSSLSDRQLNPSLATAASNLLLDMQSIQSSDPIIQEGKRSIQKELARIQDFIHKFSGKDVAADTICHRRGTAAKKRVSFPQIPQQSQIPLTTLYSDLEEARDFNEQIEMNDYYIKNNGEVKEVKEISEEGEEDDNEGGGGGGGGGQEEEGFSGKSGNSGRLEGHKEKFGLSPPQPVHMETRRC